MNASVTTNGIVLPLGSKVINLLENVVPEIGQLVQLESGLPVLYDVKTNIKSKTVSSVDELKQNPEKYRNEVVEFSANGSGSGISIQESIEAATEKHIPVDVRLEGMVVWNKVNIPPHREEFLLTAGASSIHQDSVTKPISGEFKFVGRFLSTTRENIPLPKGWMLVIYDREKIGALDYEAMAKSAKETIDNESNEKTI